MPFEQAVAQGLGRRFQRGAKRLRRVVVMLPYSWLDHRAAREFGSGVDVFLSRSSNGSVPVLHQRKSKARRYEATPTGRFGAALRCPG